MPPLGMPPLGMPPLGMPPLGMSPALSCALEHSRSDVFCEHSRPSISVVSASAAESTKAPRSCASPRSKFAIRPNIIVSSSRGSGGPRDAPPAAAAGELCPPSPPPRSESPEQASRASLVVMPRPVAALMQSSSLSEQAPRASLVVMPCSVAVRMQSSSLVPPRGGDGAPPGALSPPSPPGAIASSLIPPSSLSGDGDGAPPGALSPSRRRDCHSAAPHSAFSRCINSDGERASAK